MTFGNVTCSRDGDVELQSASLLAQQPSNIRLEVTALRLLSPDSLVENIYTSIGFVPEFSTFQM